MLTSVCPGVKHVTTTSRKTEAELNTLRKGPTNKASFMSVLGYLQQYSAQKRSENMKDGLAPRLVERAGQ